MENIEPSLIAIDNCKLEHGYPHQDRRFEPLPAPVHQYLSCTCMYSISRRCRHCLDFELAVSQRASSTCSEFCPAEEDDPHSVCWMDWAPESIKDAGAAALVDEMVHWRFSGLERGEQGRFLWDKASSRG